MRTTATPLFQRRRQLKAGCADGRCHSKQKRGENSKQQREAEHAEIGRDIERYGKAACRNPEQQMAGWPREGYSQGRAQQREDETLCQQLHNQPQAGCANGHAHCNLA